MTQWKVFRKFLWIDSAIEWALVEVGTFLLSRYGRYDLIPQLFGVIIGLHFLPLARIFHLPRYYWVGGIMIVGEVCSLLAARGDFRNIIGCMSIGMTLWVTSVIILFGLWGLPEISAFDRSATATLPATK